MSKQSFFLLIGTLAVTLVALPGLAHDPKEHEAESVSPDCAAMKDMDTSKMAKDDPVLMAMLQKCGDAMNDEAEHDHSEAQSTSDSHHSEDVNADAHESH
ncbi:MAG: hypothetical protein O7G86_18785 [Gammaproteobacteria bacterium]|nr:hypothetical protein [Gammaproteobacteria bacterium]